MAFSLPRTGGLNPFRVEPRRNLVHANIERVKPCGAKRAKLAIADDIEVIRLYDCLPDHFIHMELVIPCGGGIPRPFNGVHDRVNIRRLGHHGGQIEHVLDQIILPVLQHVAYRAKVNAIQKLHDPDAIPAHSYGVIHQPGEHRQYIAPAKRVLEQDGRTHGVVD